MLFACFYLLDAFFTDSLTTIMCLYFEFNSFFLKNKHTLSKVGHEFDG